MIIRKLSNPIDLFRMPSCSLNLQLNVIESTFRMSPTNTVLLLISGVNWAGSRFWDRFMGALSNQTSVEGKDVLPIAALPSVLTYPKNSRKCMEMSFHNDLLVNNNHQLDRDCHQRLKWDTVRGAIMCNHAILERMCNGGRNTLSVKVHR